MQNENNKLMSTNQKSMSAINIFGSKPKVLLKDIYYREKQKDGSISKNLLDFNDPIVKLAAKKNGYEYEDCIFKLFL